MKLLNSIEIIFISIYVQILIMTVAPKVSNDQIEQLIRMAIQPIVNI